MLNGFGSFSPPPPVRACSVGRVYTLIGTGVTVTCPWPICHLSSTHLGHCLQSCTLQWGAEATFLCSRATVLWSSSPSCSTCSMMGTSLIPEVFLKCEWRGRLSFPSFTLLEPPVDPKLYPPPPPIIKRSRRSGVPLLPSHNCHPAGIAARSPLHITITPVSGSGPRKIPHFVQKMRILSARWNCGRPRACTPCSLHVHGGFRIFLDVDSPPCCTFHQSLKVRSYLKRQLKFIRF